MIDGDDRRAERHIDAARGDEEGAVAQRPADPREIAALPADLVGGAPTAGEDDELVAGAVDPARHALQELGAERLDVDHEDADHVRAAAAQALRDEARLVAELLDHGPDPLRGRLGDAPAVVDHLGHGRHRDARLGGDIANRHATVRHARESKPFRNRYRKRLTERFRSLSDSRRDEAASNLGQTGRRVTGKPWEGRN